MTRFQLVVWSVMSMVGAAGTASSAQASQPQAPSATAPGFVRLDGELRTAQNEPRTGPVVMIVSLYTELDGTSPLWFEQQTVILDQSGRYAVFAGASQADGLPREWFLNNAAQWIGLAVQGEPELPRVRMASVPYALSAANADTLGGTPAAEFVMTSNLAERVRTALSGENGNGAASQPGVLVSTANFVPKFSDTNNNTIDSNIFDLGGNIGIGTTSPLTRFQVRSASGRNIALYDAGGMSTIEAFNDAGNMNTTLRFQAMAFNFNVGNLGVGSTMMPSVGGGFIPRLALTAPFPAISLESTMSAKKWGIGIDANGSLDIFESSANGYSNRVFVTNDGRVGIGTSTPFAKLQIRTASGKNLAFYDAAGAPTIEAFNDTGSTNTNLRFQAAAFDFAFGNVGIGTSSPAAKLHVAGSVLVDGNIGAKYQDVAEWVDATAPIDDGTIVILDPRKPNHVTPSARAYDTRVAGAVSRQPGVVLGEAGDNKELVSHSGRVRIKVDASYGAIKIGDLLVTSPTQGHAMRSRPMKIGDRWLHRPGTLLGKALEQLPAGRGEILVLLTLQ